MISSNRHKGMTAVTTNSLQVWNIRNIFFNAESLLLWMLLLLLQHRNNIWFIFYCSFFSLTSVKTWAVQYLFRKHSRNKLKGITILCFSFSNTSGVLHWSHRSWAQSNKTFRLIIVMINLDLSVCLFLIITVTQSV